MGKDIYYFPYAGSKARLIPSLRLLFPLSCTDFYELCGGSGYLSINLNGFYGRTVYNEYCPHIFRLFHLLKDPKKRDELIDRLAKAPRTSEYFMVSHGNYENGFAGVKDEFDKAAQMFIKITQSYMNTAEASYAGKYMNPTELRRRLKAVAAELRDIDILNESCFKLIKELNDSRYFLYIDPPYYEEEGIYKAGLGWNKYSHIRLAKTCVDSSAKIMISGRSTIYYDAVFSENPSWRKFYLDTLPSPNNKGGGGEPKDEYVYINYSNFSRMAERSDMEEVPFCKTIYDIDD